MRPLAFLRAWGLQSRGLAKGAVPGARRPRPGLLAPPPQGSRARARAEADANPFALRACAPLRACVLCAAGAEKPRSIVFWPHPPLGTPSVLFSVAYWLRFTNLLYLSVLIGSPATLSSPRISHWRRPHPLSCHQAPPPVGAGSSSAIQLSFILHLALDAWDGR